eukprot:357556-Chlamydomonas_euryale.AAC.4
MPPLSPSHARAHTRSSDDGAAPALLDAALPAVPSSGATLASLMERRGRPAVRLATHNSHVDVLRNGGPAGAQTQLPLPGTSAGEAAGAQLGGGGRGEARPGGGGAAAPRTPCVTIDAGAVDF